jgi:hypothetical protein
MAALGRGAYLRDHQHADSHVIAVVAGLSLDRVVMGRYALMQAGRAVD